VSRPAITLSVAPPLRMFLARRHREDGLVAVACDGTSTLGHVVEAAGIPLTEVGTLAAGGRPVRPSYRPRGGERVRVEPVARPQRLAEPRFALDVHLGALARRMRLLGLDVAYSNDLDDDALIGLANAQRRILLTRDRGLLKRRALRRGAYVRGDRADDQLRDVIGRFAPPLAPWTRCPACNGLLAPVAKQEVESRLRPGTRRTYQEFSRCRRCGQVYWRGAHGDRLRAIVAAAAGGG